MNRSRHRLGLALGVLGTCLFGGTLPATRLAVAGLDALWVTAARAAIAGSVAVAVLLLARRRLSAGLWGETFAAAVCTVIGFPLFAALAMRSLPAGHGGVVLGILPLATAAFAAIFARERPSAGFWLASALGAVAVMVFMVRRGGGLAPIAAGDLYLLGTVVSGALGYTLSGRLAARMPGWEVISWQVAMLLPAAAAATIALWPAEIGAVPMPAWAGLAYVGLVSQYSAFFVFNAAMAIAGIARIGQIMLLQPFVVVALAHPVNGEPVDLETLLFAAVVVASVLVGQRMRVSRG